MSFLMILQTGGQLVVSLTESLVTCRVYGIQRIFRTDHVSKASSRQETAFVIVHASDQTYVVPVYVYGHKHREDIGLIQPDLCVDPDM